MSSYLRESPSKRSPYDRSPAKVLSSERDYIEEEIRLKSAYRSQAENRRLLDEISLLQIRTRKIDEVEAKCDALQKQNSLLILENDNLSKELSERRYDLERIKSNNVQVQERDAVRCHQLQEINRSLEIEAELLKKERLESNKLYESHIQKLELMLEDRIKENEVLSQKANDLVNEKEIAEIRFEEEKNKLKNLMTRTSYDLERELEYNKDKQSTEKFVELETLKKNHSSQLAVLEDEISKLKAANAYKNTEFESQLHENKKLKERYEEEMKALIIENDAIRERILKLQQMNKTEVEKIQEKYSEIHSKGTHSLKEQHQREIMLLLQEIDREKWIITEKNTEIQNLIREKRQQQAGFRERELVLTSEIDSLKNKLEIEQNESTNTIQELTRKNINLGNKNLRDSENYFERAKGFMAKVKELEAEVQFKQAELENEKSIRLGIEKELTSMIEELTDKLIRREATINDMEYQISQLEKAGNSSQEQSQERIQELKNQISALEASLENEQKSKAHATEQYANELELLKITNSTLNQTVGKLEQKLTQEQESHSAQLRELSQKTADRVGKLQALNKKLFDELNSTHKSELDTLNVRIEKLERDKQGMEAKLQEYVELYEGLQKYFDKPHDGPAFKEKGSSSIYQSLLKTSKSTVHIF